jgi:hypothetical protein
VQEWYRGELKRMHAAFKASASKEVSELRRAMESLAERNDKLEMQKKLLLAQVGVCVCVCIEMQKRLLLAQVGVCVG